MDNSKKYIKLGRDITIDETMVFLRGKCSMIFYMANKTIKWSFKFYCMVDSKTNYLLDMIFDPGKKYKEIVASNTKESYSRQIVLTLVDKLPETNQEFLLIHGTDLFN